MDENSHASALAAQHRAIEEDEELPEERRESARERLDEIHEEMQGEDDDLATDGGSKYVVETGDGYCGTYKISTGTAAVNLTYEGIERGTTVHLWRDENGVVASTDAPDFQVSNLLHRAVNEDGYLEVPLSILEHLEVENGDDVRLYRASEAIGRQFLIVSAADDPRLVADGGHPVGHSPNTVHPNGFKCGHWWCDSCRTTYGDRDPYSVVDGRFYCSPTCLIEAEQFLRGDLHLCDSCQRVFDDLQELGEHTCLQAVRGQGGMTIA